MKKSRQYAEALYEATEGKGPEECDAIFERFAGLIRGGGYTSLTHEILAELERVSHERSTGGCILRVKNVEDVPRYTVHIARDRLRLGVSDDLSPLIECDPTLVGGYELRSHGVRIDRSHKRILRDMYLNLISHG